MSDVNTLGFGVPRPRRLDNVRTEYVVLRPVLHRVLAFLDHSIDDVVNDPIVKNKVIGYYKLHRFVERRCDMLELEAQWNPAGRRL